MNDNLNVIINNGWISVEGLGRIGMYSNYDQCILLDYSMKWIVGTNERIYCSIGQVESKIKELFKNEKN
jgi:hypothetical protein